MMDYFSNWAMKSINTNIEKLKSSKTIVLDYNSLSTGHKKNAKIVSSVEQNLTRFT